MTNVLHMVTLSVKQPSIYKDSDYTTFLTFLERRFEILTCCKRFASKNLPKIAKNMMFHKNVN